MTVNNLLINYNTGSVFGLNAEKNVRIPFTNLMIGEEHNDSGLRIRNEPGSRKRVTFAHRQRDVLSFELLNSELLLARLKGQS